MNYKRTRPAPRAPAWLNEVGAEPLMNALAQEQAVKQNGMNASSSKNQSTREAPRRYPMSEKDIRDTDQSKTTILDSGTAGKLRQPILGDAIQHSRVRSRNKAPRLGMAMQEDLDAAAALRRGQEGGTSEMACIAEHADASLLYKKLSPLCQPPAMSMQSSLARNLHYSNAFRSKGDTGIVNMHAYNLKTESGSTNRNSNHANNTTPATSMDVHSIRYHDKISNPATAVFTDTEGVFVQKAAAFPDPLASSALGRNVKDLQRGESSQTERLQVPENAKAWLKNSVVEMETPPVQGGYGSPVELAVDGTPEQPRGHTEGGTFVAASFWRPLEERTGRRSFIDHEVEDGDGADATGTAQGTAGAASQALQAPDSTRVRSPPRPMSGLFQAHQPSLDTSSNGSHSARYFATRLSSQNSVVSSAGSAASPPPAPAKKVQEVAVELACAGSRPRALHLRLLVNSEAKFHGAKTLDEMQTECAAVVAAVQKFYAGLEQTHVSYEQPAIGSCSSEFLWTSENPLLANVSTVGEAAADSFKPSMIFHPDANYCGKQQKENVFNVPKENVFNVSEPRQSVGAESKEPCTIQGSLTDTFQFDTPFMAATAHTHTQTAGAPSKLFKVSSGSMDPAGSSKGLQAPTAEQKRKDRLQQLETAIKSFA